MIKVEGKRNRDVLACTKKPYEQYRKAQAKLTVTTKTINKHHCFKATYDDDNFLFNYRSSSALFSSTTLKCSSDRATTQK